MGPIPAYGKRAAKKVARPHRCKTWVRTRPPRAGALAYSGLLMTCGNALRTCSTLAADTWPM